MDARIHVSEVAPLCDTPHREQHFSRGGMETGQQLDPMHLYDSPVDSPFGSYWRSYRRSDRRSLSGRQRCPMCEIDNSPPRLSRPSAYSACALVTRACSTLFSCGRSLRIVTVDGQMDKAALKHCRASRGSSFREEGEGEDVSAL